MNNNPSTFIFADGHHQTQDDRDQEQVRVLNMALYGQPCSPDDAQQARLEREDDEALWTARLASPDVAAEKDA